MCLWNKITISWSQSKIVKAKIDYTAKNAALAMLIHSQPLLITLTTSFFLNNSKPNINSTANVMDVDLPVQTLLTSLNNLKPIT